MKNDTREMSMSKEAKQIAWTEHYEMLPNLKPAQGFAARRLASLNHYWNGDEDHLKDEVGQSCRPKWWR